MPASNNGGASNTDGRRFVQLGFKPGNGCIPDSVMQEIVSRLTGYVAAPTNDGYIRSVSAPSDLTATWVPVDANGNRVGNNRVYDPATGLWTDDFGSGVPGIIFISEQQGNKIVVGSDQGIYVAPRKFAVINHIISASGTTTLNFPEFGIPVERIGVGLTFRSDPGSNNDMRIYIESLTDGELKLKILGFNNVIVPSVNLRVEIYEL